MEIKLVSKGEKKAEVIIIENTTYGKVYTTRHLLFRNGVWRDEKGNTYNV